MTPDPVCLWCRLPLAPRSHPWTVDECRIAIVLLVQSTRS